MNKPQHQSAFQLFRSHKMDLLALLRLFTAGNEISLPFHINSTNEMPTLSYI